LDEQIRSRWDPLPASNITKAIAQMKGIPLRPPEEFPPPALLPLRLLWPITTLGIELLTFVSKHG
jgi:hypothetical protein